MPKRINDPRAAYTVDTPANGDEVEQSNEVVHRDKIEGFGFARMSHYLTLDTRISDGAYRTYALLLKYAQQKGSLFAGIKNLALNRDVSPATMSRHLDELVALRLISRERRMGHSTITYIEKLDTIY